ncbi:unnamed protein product, partial [Rotaria sp. Silwood1]
MNTFSCSTADDKTMEILTSQIGYRGKKKKFNENLTVGNLLEFLNDLEAIRDSINAFKAAWNGGLDRVKEFLAKNPTYKDKPGPWGTTLLYSAAKNAHDYKVIPKAGSTALHGACFAGHLDVVKYLVEHSANYFIKNQAEETPLENIEQNLHIAEYFKTIINPGYSKQRTNLPTMPIIQGSIRPGEDCIWEYKSLFDDEWIAFDDNKSKHLSKSLVIKQGEKFQHEVHLSVHAVDDSVSLSRFLRNQQANMEWVRCRGSSILNFDCFALWQIHQSSETHLLPLDTLQMDEDTNTSKLLNNDEDETDIKPENYFNDSIANVSQSQLPLPVKTSIPLEDTEALKKKLAEVEEENKKVKEQLAGEQRKVDSLFSLYDDSKEKSKIEQDKFNKKIDRMRLKQEEREQKWLENEKQIKQKYEEEVQ